MRHARAQVRRRDQLTDQRHGPHRPRRQRSARRMAPVGQRGHRPSPARSARKVMEKTTGIASERLLPPFARQRFTTWFKQARRGSASSRRQGQVAVFPTCLVEYQNPAIGQDLVKVYERNGIECSLVDGAVVLRRAVAAQRRRRPLHEGRGKNVKALADARPRRQRHRRAPAHVQLRAEEGLRRLPRRPRRRARRGAHLRRRRVPDEGAQGRAARRSTPTSPATCPTTVTYHAPCHLRAQNIGLKSRDLMKLTGAKVTLVQQCSGIDGMWGLRAENAELSLADRPRSWPPRSSGPAATSWPATATSPTPPSPSRPGGSRSTRSRSSPGPTASRPSSHAEAVARPVPRPMRGRRPARGPPAATHRQDGVHEERTKGSGQGRNRLLRCVSFTHPTDHFDPPWGATRAGKGHRLAAAGGVPGAGPGIFYPETDEEADSAKAVCGACGVRSACLEHALQRREKQGVWGGCTERERRRIIRQRRRSA